MNKQANFSGYLLTLAGSTFWFGWFLMPDAGTTDAMDILNVVKHARMSVYYSSVTQIISAVLYLTALFLLAQLYGTKKKITLAGIILFGIGAMGMCVDAFFHQLTYFMTDETVNVDDSIIRVIDLIQKERILMLTPLLFSFFLGSLLLTAGLNRQAIISKIPLLLNFSALSIIPISAIAAKSPYLEDGNLLSLSMYGLMAMSHTFLGSELIISIQDQRDLFDDVAKSPQSVQRP